MLRRIPGKILKEGSIEFPERIPRESNEEMSEGILGEISKGATKCILVIRDFSLQT